MRKRELKWLNFMLVVLLIGSVMLQGMGTNLVKAAVQFSGGDGTVENPYLVATAEQLNEVRNHLNMHFKQTENIDLSVYGNWEPIGTSNNGFKGSYDGQHFSISKLTITESSLDYVGLFGYVTDALLKNIRLDEAEIIGRQYVGGLAGYILHSEVIKSSISGKITGVSTVGGLAGQATGVIITECYAIGSVTATAKVMSNVRYAGGLVGVQDFSQRSDSIISNSYAISEINGGNDYGGLVGFSNTKIENSFAAGKVGNKAETFPGGIIGSFSGTTNINYKNNFYDKDTTGRTDSRGAIGKTTLEMISKATFTEWDFENIWAIDAGSYPYLQFQESGFLPPYYEQPVFPNCPTANTTDDPISNVQPETNNWKQVSVGNHGHMMALHANGTLWAWGNNQNGQLGIGNTKNQLLPVQVGTDTWKHISAGSSHTVGIKTDGTMWAWGSEVHGYVTSSGDGRLGIGECPKDAIFISPQQIGVEANWEIVNSGVSHNYAVNSSGKWYVWGSGIFGKLGIEKDFNGNIYEPVPFPDFEWRNAENEKVTGSPADLHPSGNYSLGIAPDNVLFAWGQNNWSQFGKWTRWSTPYEYLPIRTVEDSGALQTIALGNSYAFGIDLNNVLWAWGLNDDGQLGLGYTINPTNTQVGKRKVIGDNTGWKDVKAGSSSGFGLKYDGTIWSWGSNTYGHTGHGTGQGNNTTPTQIGTDNDWAQISMKQGPMAAAIKSDGSLWVWGWNYYGQLGLGDTVDRLEPVSLFEQIWFEESEYFVEVNKIESTKLNIEVIEENVTYIITNPEIAMVDSAGEITGKQTGITTLKAIVGDKTAETTIHVFERVIKGIEEAKVVTYDDIIIDIPGGAANETFTLLINSVDKDDLPKSQEIISKVYDIQKDFDGNFEKSLTFTFTYTPVSLKDGMRISLFWLNEGTGNWIELEGDINVNEEENTVRGTVNHFTKFAVLAIPVEEEDPDPAEPDIDTSELEALIVMAKELLPVEESEAKDALNEAIIAAELVADNPESKDAVNSAIIALQNAITDFENTMPSIEISWPLDPKIAISDLNHNSFTISFPKAIGDVSHYFVAVDSLNERLPYKEGSDTYFHEITGLQPSTTYKVNVIAFNSTGDESEPLSVSVTTKAKPSSGGGGSPSPDPSPVDPGPVTPPVDPTPEEPEPEPVVKFTDTSGNWAEDYIQQAASLGLIKGFPDGSFKPNQQLTRAQAISIIVRALNLETDESSPFDDIGKFAEETQAEIAAAYHFGLIIGQNGKFMPSNKVTRAQIALMLHRAYEYKTGAKYIATENAPYPDFGSYDEETVNAITMLYELRIATGSDGKYKPNHPTTRAHAAKMIVNFFKAIE